MVGPLDGTPMTCSCGADFTWPETCPGCGMTIEYRRATALIKMMLDTPPMKRNERADG